MLTKEEIIKRKRHGDLKTVADIIGISNDNAYRALNREDSKYHSKVVELLSAIIINRETLENQAKTA